MYWMLLTLLYGVFKGIREVVKKKALSKSTVMEVLVFYTLIGFIIVLPQAKDAGGLTGSQYFFVFIKALAVFSAWICSFHAIKKMPISLYGVLDLSRVLFATLLGVTVLGEQLRPLQTIGLIFVCTGLLMLKYKPKPKAQDTNNTEEVPAIIVVCAFASCMLNAISGLLDKILMKEMNSSQLQFWYMLFMLLLYLGYCLIGKVPIRWKQSIKNYWIWILSVLFVIADKALFIANSHPDSRVTVMTLIKQSGCVVTILAGKLIFKEKNVGYKLLCALVIIAGIMAGVLS